MKDIAIEELCLEPGQSISDALNVIDHGARGIALVVDPERRLIGTLTDGDIRRAILAGVDLSSPISVVMERKAGSSYSQPIVALEGTDHSLLLALMKEHSVRHIPLVDSAQQVKGIITLDQLIPDQQLPLQAVIMAGGFGKRLFPLTADTPKPMLPLGGRPLLEHIIGQLRLAGIATVNITTHYLAEKITDYFGDGSSFGVQLNYVSEDRPLGTAGALGLIETPREPILVINGDIVTRVDFRAMLAFHREHQADLTVAVRQYDMQVPYGVVASDGPYVQKILEKPQYQFLVNAGIYLLEPEAYHYIPQGERFDMPDLIQTLLHHGRAVASFPIVEYWLDIGQVADYEQAEEDMRTGRLSP